MCGDGHSARPSRAQLGTPSAATETPISRHLGKGTSVLRFRAALGRACLCSHFASPWEGHVFAPISRHLGKGMSVLRFRAALGRACLCSHFASPWEGHVFAPISRHLGEGHVFAPISRRLREGHVCAPISRRLGKGMSLLRFRVTLGRACLCSHFAPPWEGHEFTRAVKFFKDVPRFSA
jgi:hypothetical protein